MPDSSWSDRAATCLPTGASTGSKRPGALYGGDPPYGPAHYVRASGCRLVTPDGGTLIDCTMALGAVTLGYGDAGVTGAVTEAAAAGNVSGLSHTLEVEVAERLCEVIPCAERVQFLKTGAEAVAAAVRLARAYTGRDTIVACGYFGWHDWCSEADGVPTGVRGDHRPVPFDDIPALERAVADVGRRLAAIVLEPVIERLPSPGWIARARALCDAHGAVLVFDEIKTGFRLARGGYQEYAGVTPDLAAFGKALANGFPLAVVCGRRELMELARRTWISSTLASEATALAAARAVLDRYEATDVCGALWRIGEEQAQVVRAAVSGDAMIESVGPMWFLRFPTPDAEARFLRQAVARGVLFKRGPYNFASLAHDGDALRAMAAAAA